MASPALNHSRELDWVEFFSGSQSVTRAMLSQGQVAVPYDVINNPHLQDINSAPGLVLATHLALKIRAGGGSNSAPVCSTW
eukprot:15264587-Alexandrium_andersonii.AAC.1